MNLYFASVYTSSFGVNSTSFHVLSEEEKYARQNMRNVLESHHYIHKGKAPDDIRRDNEKIFLDSGAFSAFTKGITVDIDGYCRWVKRNQDIIRVDDTGMIMASVVDGIGDPLQTYKNQYYMERQGVMPLPCFHYGEDERYLEHYIANYPYITLGGMVPVSTPQLYLWLDRIWSEHLTHADGTPKIKVHGFGLTSLDLMLRYPWYSVDSSSWLQSANNGGIMLAAHRRTLFVSENSPNRKVDGQHYRTISPTEQDVIRKYVENAGFTIERLEKMYQARWAFNMAQYTLFEDIVTEEGAKVFFVDQPTLF